MKDELYVIRDMMPDDFNFIITSWLKGLRYGNSWYKEIDSAAYFQKYQLFIKNLLSLPITQVKVACLKDDAEVILGYAVMHKTDPTLHWVFVKDAWRGIGIAKSLVNPDTKVVTHLTKTGLTILRKTNKAIFDPFLS